VEEYVNDLSKMALALTSAQLAKGNAIKDFGVGEEIPLHLLGWTPLQLRIICQMRRDVANKSPEDRFERCSVACAMIRKLWGASSITMVSEAYCSKDSNKTKGLELSKAFTDHNLPVYECIAVSHVSIGDDGSVAPVSMVAAPFTIGLGKNIQWHDVLVYPEIAEKHTIQRKYPTMMKRAISENTLIGEIPGEQIDEMKNEMHAVGFIFQEF
jgi:hypothetical protein